MWPFTRKKAAAPPPPTPSVTRQRFRRIPQFFSRTEYDLKTSEVIFAAVSRISNTLGCIPMRLYKDFAVQDNSPLNDLVARQPNSNMSPFDFFRIMEASRNTEGNAYALMVPAEDGSLHHLDVLDATRVEPVLHEGTGELWYQLNAPGKTLYVHGSQMIAVKHICTNGYKGIRPVDVLRGALDYEAGIRSFSLKHLEQGVNGGLVLSIPSELGREKKKAMITDFLDAYKESGQSLIVLDAGASATRMDGSPVDPHVLDTERITRNRVATVYNIPPHMLGDYTDTAFNTMEQQMLEFIQLTMLPICRMYEDEINRKLLTSTQTKQGYAFRFNLNALLQGDSAARAEYNFKMIRSAGSTPNEVRAAEGRPSLPGGDRLYVSRDLVALEDLPKLLAK